MIRFAPVDKRPELCDYKAVDSQPHFFEDSAMGFNNTSSKTVGTFTLVGENTRHEYVECPEWLAAAFPGFPVAIPCLDGTFRACRVSKTRAYVVVDETETGEPVVETWPIRGHHVRVGSWDCLLPAQVSDFS